MQSTAFSDAYLRFVSLLLIFEATASSPKLDHVEKKLLEFIAIHEIAGKHLLVSDVIYLNEIGSPATLHRRISRLEKANLIRYAADIDGRKKWIELTTKAKDYFSQLGKCMLKATDGLQC